MLDWGPGDLSMYLQEADDSPQQLSSSSNDIHVSELFPSGEMDLENYLANVELTRHDMCMTAPRSPVTVTADQGMSNSTSSNPESSIYSFTVPRSTYLSPNASLSSLPKKATAARSPVTVTTDQGMSNSMNSNPTSQGFTLKRFRSTLFPKGLLSSLSKKSTAARFPVTVTADQGMSNSTSSYPEFSMRNQKSLQPRFLSKLLLKKANKKKLCVGRVYLVQTSMPHVGKKVPSNITANLPSYSAYIPVEPTTPMPYVSSPLVASNVEIDSDGPACTDYSSLRWNLDEDKDVNGLREDINLNAAVHQMDHAPEKTPHRSENTSRNEYSFKEVEEMMCVHSFEQHEYVREEYDACNFFESYCPFMEIDLNPPTIPEPKSIDLKVIKHDHDYSRELPKGVHCHPGMETPPMTKNECVINHDHAYSGEHEYVGCGAATNFRKSEIYLNLLTPPFSSPPSPSSTHYTSEDADCELMTGNTDCMSVATSLFKLNGEVKKNRDSVVPGSSSENRQKDEIRTKGTERKIGQLLKSCATVTSKTISEASTSKKLTKTRSRNVDPSVREAHNENERRRREVLNKEFDRLNIQIFIKEELEEKKPTKIMTLRNTIKCICDLSEMLNTLHSLRKNKSGERDHLAEQKKYVKNQLETGTNSDMNFCNCLFCVLDNF